jgi:hypothetical protein
MPLLNSPLIRPGKHHYKNEDKRVVDFLRRPQQKFLFETAISDAKLKETISDKIKNLSKRRISELSSDNELENDAQVKNVVKETPKEYPKALIPLDKKSSLILVETDNPKPPVVQSKKQKRDAAKKKRKTKK